MDHMILEIERRNKNPEYRRYERRVDAEAWLVRLVSLPDVVRVLLHEPICVMYRNSQED